MNNSDLAYAGLGPCEEHEFELVELVDGALAAERVMAVQQHLEGCGRCRAFVHEMRAIDASLAGALPQVRLSADFDARLQERIAQLARAVPKEAARAAAEDEYRSILRELRRGLTWRAALNAASAGAVGAALAFGIGAVAPAALQSTAGLEPLAGPLGLYVAGIAVVGGLLAPRLLRRSPGLPMLG
ncbi:MAG TPA: zf-HC2 domain-containing protein [Steroidobacteraceae bacterium]|nr:zf-HC2 domain-containing protein [Steroidobacteraceae bacterium]